MKVVDRPYLAPYVCTFMQQITKLGTYARVPSRVYLVCSNECETIRSPIGEHALTNEARTGTLEL